MKTKKTTGLYIHFPFCKRECYYCSFTKFTFNKERIEKYLLNLQKELIKKSKNSYLIDTVFLGGGSPSLINSIQLDRLFETIYTNFTLVTNPEITIEINPEDLNKKIIRTYKKNGINRISLGSQSFSEDDLCFLKRTHTNKDSFKGINDLKEQGFNNINCDLIIGLPQQNKKRIDQNLQIFEKMNITHISIYILENVLKGDIFNQRASDLYYHSKLILEQSGYKHYEISNYAKHKFECKHNLKYWTGKDYIGVGLSASGYEKNIDYKNTTNLKEYNKFIQNDQFPVFEKQKLSEQQRKIITGLRLINGIHTKILEKSPDSLDKLLSQNILINKGNKTYISADKLLVLNEILHYFV